MADLEAPGQQSQSPAGIILESASANPARCDTLKTSVAFEATPCDAQLTLPVVPSAEIEASSEGGLHVQASSNLPACETPGSGRIHLLVLSSFVDYPDAADLQLKTSKKFSITYRHVNSVERYEQELKLFLDDNRMKEVADQRFVHLLATNEDNQPLVGGRVVSERELHGPLHALCSDDQPTKTSVFHLTYKTPTSPAPKLKKQTSPSRSVSFEDDFRYVSTRRASLCGSEFYNFSIANLLQVHEGLGVALEAMVASGVDPTCEEMARRIETCCDGAKLVRVSGVPNAAQASRDAPAVPDVPAESEVAAVPNIPLSDGPADGLQMLLNKPSTECEQSAIDICVGVIIKDYSQCGTSNRTGADKDIGHIRKTAQHLKCCQEDIHLLCPDDGHVSKSQITQHIEQVRTKYDGKRVRKVFVFISAHGKMVGIKTSSGEVVQVQEVLSPLQKLGGFIVLFYQACRGGRHHSVNPDSNSPPITGGLSFCSPDISGCCLPPGMQNCAAIFASMAGFKCYRSEADGSWMLRALADVVSARERSRALDVKQLCQMTQERLHHLRPEGEMNTTERGWCYVQTQFTVQGGGCDAVITTGT